MASSRSTKLAYAFHYFLYHAPEDVNAAEKDRSLEILADDLDEFLTLPDFDSQNILEDTEIKWEIVCVKSPHTSKPRPWGSYKTQERAQKELHRRQAQGHPDYEFRLSKTAIKRQIIDGNL